MLKSQPPVSYTPRPMRRLFPLAAALTCAMLSATLAMAAPLPAPVAPAHAVAAGEWVETSVPALPGDIEEFELLLVPSEGPAVRVSRELPAGTRVIRWCMPAVAARSAKLVLRAGGEGEELESQPSLPFRLAELPATELDRVRTGHSEAGYEIVTTAGGACAGELSDPEAPTLAPTHAIPAVVPAPATGLGAPAGAARRLAPSSSLAVLAPARTGGAGRLPAFRPLRN